LFYLDDDYLNTIHSVLTNKYPYNNQHEDMVQQIKDTANMLLSFLNDENELERIARQYTYWSGIYLFNDNIFTSTQIETITVILKYQEYND
jgi:hypothetical protein